MLPAPLVEISLTSTSEEGCEDDMVADDSDSLTCVAGVVSNLLYPPSISLIRDGSLLDTVDDVTLQYSRPQSGQFNCTVCINIPDAKIKNYCSSTVIAISSNGEYIMSLTTGGYDLLFSPQYLPW